MSETHAPRPEQERPATAQPAGPRNAPFEARLGTQGPRLGPVAIALIAASVVVAFYSSLGNDTARLYPLFISLSGAGSTPGGFLPEVRHGEVWRLLTPMFIHFGPMHLIFNMLWVNDLGGLMERREGSGRFLAMVLVLALLSDLGQYFVSGPFFGGMSGVVYGLFGYVWLRGKFDPASGYGMPQQTIVIMVVWFAFCLTGYLNIANTAHGVGLAVGALWGFLSAQAANGRSAEQV